MPSLSIPPSSPISPFDEVERLATILKGLADPSRLAIVRVLARDGPMNVGQIRDVVGQSQPAVSHHLSLLRSAGLVRRSRSGKFNVYELDGDGLLEALRGVCGGEEVARVLLGGVEILVGPGGQTPTPP